MKLNREIFPPLLLFIIAFLVWSHIPSLQFIGEGFYYFAQHIIGWSIGDQLTHDIFARILMSFLPVWFGPNVQSYMWFLLFYMLMTNLVMYVVFRIITKSRLAAFFITFLFSTSYAANYDMYSIGGYQYFVQRGAILLPLLLSFAFFVLYFNQRFQLRYYAISLALFVFAIIMGFFGTWFLPPFIIYPIFYLLFNLSKKDKFLMKIIWTPLPFLVSNVLLIRQSSFIPVEEHLIEFIFNKFWYVIAGILQQLAVITPPVGDIARFFGKGTLHFKIILALTALFYAGALIIIIKISRQFRVFAATSLLSLMAMLLLNEYLNAAAVLNTFGSSRYFYYPVTFLAFFWGIFFSAIASRKGIVFKLLIFSICFIWLFYNIYRINKNLVVDAWMHRANRETIEYVEQVSKAIKENSIIYLPSALGAYGAEFIVRFYGKPATKIVLESLEPLDLPALANLNFNPDRLYVLGYDPQKQIIVDKTEESRVLLRDIKQKK